MTEHEIYALPVVIPYRQAARAHGIGPKLARQLKNDGKLPFPTRPQGRAMVVTKHQLLESLHMPAVRPESAGVAANASPDIHPRATPADHGHAQPQADPANRCRRGGDPGLRCVRCLPRPATRVPVLTRLAQGARSDHDAGRSVLR